MKHYQLCLIFVGINFLSGCLGEKARNPFKLDRWCADDKCETPISTGLTQAHYSAVDEGRISFKKDERAEIFSKHTGKNEDLWGVKIGNRQGLINFRFIREDKIFIKDGDLIFVSSEDKLKSNVSSDEKRHVTVLTDFNDAENNYNNVVVELPNNNDRIDQKEIDDEFNSIRSVERTDVKIESRSTEEIENALSPTPHAYTVFDGTTVYDDEPLAVTPSVTHPATSQTLVPANNDELLLSPRLEVVPSGQHKKKRHDSIALRNEDETTAQNELPLSGTSMASSVSDSTFVHPTIAPSTDIVKELHIDAQPKKLSEAQDKFNNYVPEQDAFSISPSVVVEESTSWMSSISSSIESLWSRVNSVQNVSEEFSAPKEEDIIKSETLFRQHNKAEELTQQLSESNQAIEQLNERRQDIYHSAEGLLSTSEKFSSSAEESNHRADESSPPTEDSSQFVQESSFLIEEPKFQLEESNPPAEELNNTTNESNLIVVPEESKPHAEESNSQVGESSPKAEELNLAVDVSSLSVEESNSPAEESNSPAEESNSSAEESNSPAEESNPPAEESNPSAEESNPSAEESNPSAEESNPPAEESNPPAEESNPPAEESNPPAEESNRPAEESNPPAEESNPPAEESNPPAEESNPPAEESNPPAEESNPPAEEPNPPAEEPNPPAEEPNPPAEEPNPPAEEPNPPAEESNLSADESNLSADESNLPADESNLPADESNLPADESNLPDEEANLLADESNLPADESNLPAEESTLLAKESTTLAEKLSNPAEREMNELDDEFLPSSEQFEPDEGHKDPSVMTKEGLIEPILHDPDTIPGKVMQTIEQLLEPSLMLAVENEVSQSRLSSGALITMLLLATTIVLLYLVHALLTKCSREGPLLEALNALEHEQHVSAALILQLRQKLAATMQNSTVPTVLTDTVELTRLHTELQQSQQEALTLSERVQQLEQELEESASSALEMHSMLQDLLHEQRDAAGFQDSVDNLQKMLDSQREKVESLTADLSIKTTLNEELKAGMVVSQDKINKLEFQLEQVSHSLEEVKSSRESVQQELVTEQSKAREATEQLLQQSQALRDSTEQLETLRTQVDHQTVYIEQLTKATRTKDTELQVTKACLKQLKVFKDADKDALAKLLDAVQLRTDLSSKQLECEHLQKQLRMQEQEVSLLRANVQETQMQAESSQKQLQQAEHERSEALSKLEVLSNYFQEKEAQLTKELESESGLRQCAEGSAQTISMRIRDYQLQLDSYKNQVESLKKELEDQEQSYRAQLAAQEQRAHESWVSARAAERKLEESKAENSQLRSRLTLASKDESFLKMSSKHTQASNGSISSPRPPLHDDLDGEHCLPLNPLDSPPLLPGPHHMLPFFPPPPPGPPLPFPPPGLPPPPPPGLPPPPPGMPPHFLPPHLNPMLSDRRLPPAGRLASPPFHRHSPLDEYMDHEASAHFVEARRRSPAPYDRRSYSPSSEQSRYSDRGPVRYSSPERQYSERGGTKRYHNQSHNLHSPERRRDSSPERWYNRSPDGYSARKPASPPPHRRFFEEHPKKGKKTSTPVGPTER